jgi:hypothetical protein
MGSEEGYLQRAAVVFDPLKSIFSRRFKNSKVVQAVDVNIVRLASIGIH